MVTEHFHLIQYIDCKILILKSPYLRVFSAVGADSVTLSIVLVKLLQHHRKGLDPGYDLPF